MAPSISGEAAAARLWEVVTKLPKGHGDRAACGQLRSAVKEVVKDMEEAELLTYAGHVLNKVAAVVLAYPDGTWEGLGFKAISHEGFDARAQAAYERLLAERCAVCAA